jgi:hypothetical protein
LPQFILSLAIVYHIRTDTSCLHTSIEAVTDAFIVSSQFTLLTFKREFRDFINKNCRQ